MSALASIIDTPAVDTRQVRILPGNEYHTTAQRLGAVSVEPYAPVVGATVRGLRYDGPDSVDDATQKLLYRSLLDFGFLSFEPGTVRPEDFETFTRLFGNARFAGNPYAPRVDGKSQANAIDSARKKTRTNYIWHIDQAYRPDPQKFTALFARKVPALGGHTIFSNATAAFNLFDPLFARYLETLTVINDADNQGLLTLAYEDPEALVAARIKIPPREVPLVRVNPETGRKQLFACELYAQRILGVSRTVSDHLLSIVFEQVKLPEIGANYLWEEGAVLIWDNRTVQHRGVYNYDNQHRLLHRAVID